MNIYLIYLYCLITTVSSLCACSGDTFYVILTCILISCGAVLWCISTKCGAHTYKHSNTH